MGLEEAYLNVGRVDNGGSGSEEVLSLISIDYLTD